VKDALATAGVRSTGGAIELVDHVPETDADVVAAVRAAGAVVWGKSNLPRWSGDIQARNPMFGATNNPWDVTRGPGGSSGGAAAGVATGMTPLEIGTDIGGSIRLPAHFSGVCGHKPSYGIVSQRGYIDRWPTAKVDADINGVGPLARRVDDLELLLDVLVRPDRTIDSVRGSGRSLRVAAWLDDPACPLNADVAAVLETAVGAIESSGINVDRTARPDHPFTDVFSIGLPLLMATLSPGRTDAEFDDLTARRSDPDPTMRMRASGSTMSHREWVYLAEQREVRRDNWSQFFTHHDVLLAPVAFSNCQATMATDRTPISSRGRSSSATSTFRRRWCRLGGHHRACRSGSRSSGRTSAIAPRSNLLEWLSRSPAVGACRQSSNDELENPATSKETYG
jgi:amidase